MHSIFTQANTPILVLARLLYMYRPTTSTRISIAVSALCLIYASL